jgi:hypothetical protein
MTHYSTKKNLHTHLHHAPMSNQQEVSAFGNDGEGDNGMSVDVCLCSHLSHARQSVWISSFKSPKGAAESVIHARNFICIALVVAVSGDHWELICSQGGDYWKRQVAVRLRGVDTGKFLATNSRHQYGYA